MMIFWEIRFFSSIFFVNLHPADLMEVDPNEETTSALKTFFICLLKPF